MKKKGLLFVINSIEPGGAEVFVLRLSNVLKEKYTLYITTIYPEKDNAEFAKYFFETTNILKIPNYSLPTNRLLKLFKIIDFLGIKIGRKDFYPKLIQLHKKLFWKKTIQKNSIRIINSHLFASDKFVLKEIKSVLNIPWVITMHSSYNPSNYITISEKDRISFLNEAKEILTSADKVICVAEINKTIFCDLILKTLPEKIYLGYNPNETIDDSKLDLLDNKDKSIFTFSMIGRTFKEKGWEIAFEAFIEVHKKHPNTRFIAVGTLNDYMESLRTSYNKSIEFTGYINDPIKIIKQTNIGLLPSFSESLPYTIIEYLGHGVPVIASNRGEIPAMINANNDIAGYILKDNEMGIPSKEDLISAMNTYIENESLYYHHKNLTKLAFEKFDITNCAKQYDSIFSALLKQ